uniref:DFDF domain-containing protein n=1 Tax=Panagrolaimus superbus TaxID=310955 RepID=A0A914Z825_9BILA
MEFIGCSVFVDCGTFGVFQGKVSAVDATSMSLTLINVMKDGEFTPGTHVLHSAEIVDIKVLKMGSARDRGEVPPRQSKTVAIKGKLAKNSSNEPTSEQSSSKDSAVKTEMEKAPIKKLKENKPVAQVEKSPTNLSENGMKIMQQLLLAPVSNPVSHVNVEIQTSKPVISQAALEKQNSKPSMSDSITIPKVSPKQKENQKPKPSPMIPTAAIKILKRGEPFPVQSKSSVNCNQQSTCQKSKPEAGDAKPQQSCSATDELKKKKNNRKSKKSESDKSQPSSESVAEFSEGSLSLNTTQSSATTETKSSATPGSTQTSDILENETLLNIDIEKVESVGSARTPVPGGIKIDPLQLISSLAAPASVSPVKFATSTPKKIVPQRSLSVNDQPVNKAPQYEKFGDFKRFTEKQAPTPCNLNSNNQRSRGNTSSPSGVPTKDFVNGYGKVHRRNRELDGPIDHNAFKDDFDFTGNLALMVKEEDEDDSTEMMKIF